MAQERSVDSEILRLQQPRNMSYDQFEGYALEQARLTALANAFGTRVEQQWVAVNDHSETYSASYVKGEWLKTTFKVFEFYENKEGYNWYTVRVKGKARSVPESSVHVEFEVTADLLGEQIIQHVIHDQRLRAIFQSPKDGYLLVFYAEGDEYYLLAKGAASDAEFVRGQVAYSLFLKSEERDKVDLGNWQLGWLDRYSWALHLTNPGSKEESGRLIAVFDQEPFSPPPVKLGVGANPKTDLKKCSRSDFEDWTRACQKKSEGFQSTVRNIILLPLKKS